jgi:cell division protease FtsH
VLKDLVEITEGYSGAQIENLLNEAMLYALRCNRESMSIEDLELTVNKILVGWQSTENILTEELLFQVAVHEMGHALIGLITNYKKLIKVTINLWSPKSLGFTLFDLDEEKKNLVTKDKLLSEIMVLLGGRVAEEIFFPQNISTGASQDLETCKNLVESMVINYGMGTQNIISSYSDKSKEFIDTEIDTLINEAYNKTKTLLLENKNVVESCAKRLADEHILLPEFINKKLKRNNKYK